MDAGRLEAINDFLQTQLRARSLAEVAAVDAAGWLDGAGLLADNPQRPGLPLRNLLRDGVIEGAVQRPPRSHGRWFVTRA